MTIQSYSKPDQMTSQQEAEDGMQTGSAGLISGLDETLENLRSIVNDRSPALAIQEVGEVAFVGQGIARVVGLPSAKSEELLRFEGGVFGMVFNLDPDELGIILLGESEELAAGTEVYHTGRVLDVPVGNELIGRVINSLGQPLDRRGPLQLNSRLPIERPAAPITRRAPVERPLQTGIKVVDALFPIGRGQRELILGDRQTGKTAIALDTIINQKDKDVICVYCAIGQRNAAVAKLIADLREHDAMEYTVVMVASGEQSPGLQFVAPYAATSIGEYFAEQGLDVLIIYDDLTRHARAYRELSLLLRRPPSREAFPGDIFYIHSRLLERSAQFSQQYGGGSLTALPIVETEAQNISAYIPTNIISITDGQIYLSPDLFRTGILPAVDIGRSVSRVGGKAQLPSYRAVAENLRLSYTQFEELESFARFGTRLDERTRKTIEHGQRVREVFKQPQYVTLPVAEQMAVFLTVAEGLLAPIDLEQIANAEEVIRAAFLEEMQELYQRIQAGERLADEDRAAFVEMAKSVLAPMQAQNHKGNNHKGNNQRSGQNNPGGRSHPENEPPRNEPGNHGNN
jgi:F-type H+/Na+-transporting ATPase subunit alpha